MSDSSNASSGGMGLLGVLAVVFITLKLCHVIDWSWWWVTCPLWGGAAFAILVLVVVLLVFGVARMFSRR